MRGKLVLIAAVLAALCLCQTAAAEAPAVSLNANDLAPAQLTETKTFDAFTVYAKSDKGVTIEAIDAARTAGDGEVFNARIKLNGSGALEYRSVSFTVKAKAKVTIYLCSSSKTDARTLKLVDAKGAAVADLVAPPDDGAKAGMAAADLPAAGTYFVYSGGSGINIYMITVQ